MKLTLGILICLFVACSAEVEPEEYIPFQGRRFDEFDWRMTKTVMAQNNGNVVISPFSIKVLLMLLAEASGTNTSTFEQLSVILPNIRVPYDGRELFQKVIKSFDNANNTIMRTGTKIYMDKNLKPRLRYSDIAKRYYETTIESVDFARANEIATVINNWCANITDNHIQNFISEDDLADVVVLMLNAVYFKGNWRQPFEREKTIRSEFESVTGVKSTVEFMKKTEKFYYFDSEQLKAKILRLPYANTRYAMFFMLPKKNSNVNELISKLESKTIAREAWYLDEVEVKVEIPKFKYEFEGDFKSILQQVGIKDIFTNDASLPLMFSPGADKNSADGHKVSNILQKAGIIVNEEGSTAYAATQVQIVNKFGEVPVEFIANRPFIFFIEDEATGTILFAGKVADAANFQ